MGWTSYHATHYKNGSVDRKAECDAYFLEGLNRGHFRVEKSTMVGSVYYAAVTSLTKYIGNNHYEELPIGEQYTFAVVFLTVVNNKDYYNFSYKDMDESYGPFYYDCPESILKLVSPTTNECALEWREKCREHNRKRKLLKKLPVGTVIEFEFHGWPKQFVLHAPAYQFTKPFWYSTEARKYIKASQIPDSYRIVEAANEM